MTGEESMQNLPEQVGCCCQAQNGQLRLTVEEVIFRKFFLFVQHGFQLDTSVGCSVRTLLCETFGLSTEFVVDRITTIFLDGRPVDDIETAILQDGMTLSLSAAMPGLVGATMRRGGFYSALRDSISYRQTGTSGGRSQGRIRIKLLNLLMHELGPEFLRIGVLVQGAELQEFLTTDAEALQSGCREIAWQGEPISWNDLLATAQLAAQEAVCLTVRRCA